jgi:hypothetical protein
MPKKPLRAQLNQIRAWVRQGRTDAWIAHQLEVSTSELREFRRRHDLTAEDEEAGDLELRDEIEAEIAAATREEELAEEEEEAEADEAEAEPEAEEEEARVEEPAAEGEAEARPRRRRRRGRRGGAGRGGRAAPAGLEATFDHGEQDGFGLWLDPAVQDDPVYSEHWAGHRQVDVTIEPDRIVIKRAGG